MRTAKSDMLIVKYGSNLLDCQKKVYRKFFKRNLFEVLLRVCALCTAVASCMKGAKISVPFPRSAIHRFSSAVVGEAF